MADLVEKFVDKLPDVWFDWYARLLPGCFGVALFIYLSGNMQAAPKGSEVVLFLLFGYGFGHILQPITGFLVKRVENVFRNEEKYARAKKDPAVKTSSLNKVSKAHAEANSMLSFCIVLLINIYVFWDSSKINRVYAIIVLLYFLWATVERISARNRKINDLEPSKPL